jgi:TRAP-type uncharacterized transport system substrate-binding protein
MLGLSRWHLVKGLAAILCIFGVVSLALIYFIPAPPSKIAMATSVIKGTTYDFYAQRYRERFARANVKLELRESRGSVETLSLLQDAVSGVQFAFMYGGTSDGEHAPGLLSLGVIYNNPFWVFYSSDEAFDRLAQLKGKRIAVGPAGTAVRKAAEQVLGTDGVTAATATFLPIAGTAAVEALRDGKVDAYWIASAPESPAIQTMLRMPNVRLMSFARAEALTRIFPDLVRLTLPQGVFDIAENIPPNDVTLIATTVRILIRDDLHPQIVSLLLQALIKEHGGPGIFQRVGEFPTQTDPEYPMAASVTDFYKNGPSLLQRHLPLWLTVHVQRAIAVLVAAIAIGIPLFSFAPKLYLWFVKSYMAKLYRRLRVVEKASQAELTVPQAIALQTELESIDQAASILPMRHSDLFLEFNRHVESARARLVSRLVEVRSQTVKSARPPSVQTPLAASRP